ncbi:TIGR01777 family oxidoreductase [bacterium]|nr:TIGR01777 family oxidoreductase [bacterium]
MKILIAGGTGLIGRALTDELVAHGHEVFILSRSLRKPDGVPAAVRMLQWDGKTAEGWADVVDEIDAVVNLAGAPLDGDPLRNLGTIFNIWLTKKRKELVVSSRLDTTKALLEGIRLAEKKPAVFVQGSAVGYYGFSGDQPIDETGAPGNDFFSETQILNERASEEAEALGMRRVIVRTGLVLDAKGGSFQYFKLQTALFVGGRMGSGEQYYPWIHIQDEARAIRYLIENEDAAGPFNLSAPNPVKNKTFAKILAKVMGRPSFFVVPAFLLRLVLGEISAIILEGQRAIPAKLEALGFKFRYPELETALKDILE